jgi:HPt (histidine-containing phosphotransfer) domain-containing protein
MVDNVSNSTVKKAIDVEFLRSIIEDDFEFEKELFEIFIENAHRNIEKMDDAIKSSNDNSWYMASHAFKGAAASIGANDLSNILEYAQKHPEASVEQKNELLKKVNDELQLVIEFINKELLSRK